MLQNWLKPHGASLVKLLQNLPDTHFGKNIQHFVGAFPDLKKARIAIVGVGEKDANAVREQLYALACPFAPSAIVDLGNLRKAEVSQLIPVIYELLSGKILPVIIGMKDELARGQFFAYQDAKALVNFTVIDAYLRWDAPDAVYTPLLAPRHPLLFHFGAVGFQTHFASGSAVQFLQKHNFDALRLGKSRASLEETEPVLRDADLLAFHLAALKQSEAPGVEKASPSGYYWEEACQLCRYAGMSDKLTSFGIYGFNRELDRDAQTAQGVAQMLWYFLDGFFSRKNDYPASTTGLTEYIVDFRQMNYQLTFWKSTKSGRWWMQVPVPTRKKHDRHRLIPCSFQDYQAACREELPERLLLALQRF